MRLMPSGQIEKIGILMINIITSLARFLIGALNRTATLLSGIFDGRPSLHFDNVQQITLIFDHVKKERGQTVNTMLFMYLNLSLLDDI